MLTVSLHYWAGAKAAAGTGRETWPADSIAEALAAARAARRDPRFERVLSVCSVLVDGLVVHPDDLARPLETSVEVEILPPFAGGAAERARGIVPPTAHEPTADPRRT